MARLIPRINPSTIENNGERLVAETLTAQLPSECRIYHSFPWLRSEPHTVTGKEHLRTGEADFVIVHPERGVLVLEVKGGTLVFDEDTGTWWREETRKVVQDPFRQAERNKFALGTLIADHPFFVGAGPLAFTIGHAVVFPDCRFTGHRPAHAPPEILIDADGVRIMDKAIDRAFGAWCPVDTPRRLQEAEFSAIVEAISPALRFTPVLWRTIEQQEERLKRLTEEQTRLLEILQSVDRAAIEGVAGSGKTILALAQAQRFAREGKRTLLLCYNRLLADWLQSQMPSQYQRLIVTLNYHSLVREFCRLARLPFGASSTDQQFWEYDAPELLERAADKVADAEHFDAIVADEGQDFRELWWLGLEKLYRASAKSRPMYVFYDPKQVIYQMQTTVPSGLSVPYPLSTNCRNTKLIAKYCAEVVEIPPRTRDEAPEGVAPRISEVKNQQELVRSVQNTVQEWCLRERGGLQLSQVAILTQSSHVRLPERIGNIPLVTDMGMWRAGGGVLIETYRRFKGLEADAVILAGVPKPDVSDRYTACDHYVAASRAKHLLEVLYWSGEVK